MKMRFLRGIKERDLKRMKSAFTSDFQGQFQPPKPEEFVQESGGFSFWSSDSQRPAVTTADAFLQPLGDIINTWATIDIVDFHAFRLHAHSGRPSNRVIMHGHLSLAGETAQQERQEIYSTVVVEFKRNDKGHWRIRKFRFDQQVWAKIRGPRFRDIAQITGFQFNASESTKRLQQAVINERHLFTNGGLTVLDFNHDGFYDILATLNEQETLLFVNDGIDGFKRESLDLIEDRSRVSKFYVWVDLDNDGKEELVGERILSSNNGQHEVGLYTFAEGKMAAVSGALTFKAPKWMYKIGFESIVPCDVNGDQLLDLIFVGYSHNDSNRQPSFINATDGMKNLVFINQGKLRFKEEGLKRGLTETKYSLVAACHDFDEDGDQDLFVGNDFGSNDYYKNDGKGQFTATPEHPFYQGSSFTMGLSIADFDNTGRYAVSISNMYSHAGNRIVPLAGQLEGHNPRDILRLASGNSLYEKVDGQWTDTGVKRNINVSGWAWANQFFDFDNDGDKDLFVTNGNNTHSDTRLPDF